MVDKELEEAMAVLRRRRDPEKLAEHARTVAASRKGSTWTEEQKARLKEAQQARREREKAERAALGLAEEPKEKRPAGRPRTRLVEGAETPKRPRGRPKKQETAN